MPIYDRQPQEPNNWYQRFLIYRDLPPGKRELLAAFRIHQATIAQGKPVKHYTQASGAWHDAFTKWQWRSRAEAYDKDVQAHSDALKEQWRQTVLTTGLATVEGRIEALKAHAEMIDQSFLNEEGKIEFKWVSADKLREYRGFLDDIAKELGQRVQRRELTGKDGGALQIQRNPDLANLQADELVTLAQLYQIAEERATK